MLLDSQALEAFLHELADASEQVVLRYFRIGLEVEDKSDESPVTQADREAEQALRELIQERFPEHGIFGEEHGHLGPEREWQWILDPIDGTRAFVSGLPLFGTLIALTHQGSLQLGLLNLPALGERWWSTSGNLAQHRQTRPHLQTRTCQTSRKQDLASCYAYSTDPSMFSEAQWHQAEQVYRSVKMRRFGGDCYSYGLLASGHIDLVLEADLKLYDIAGPMAVVEASGGRVTDWRGNSPLEPGWDGTVLASASRELHQLALNQLTLVENSE